MVQTMIGRDSVRPAAIPPDGADYIMGYANGPVSQWPASAWADPRFAGKRLVRIDTQNTDPRADVLDVERGDATIADAPGWVRDGLAERGPLDYRPVLYLSRSTLIGLEPVMSRAGLQLVRDYRLGVATLDGTRTLPDMTGVTYVQYAGANLTGGQYDQSIIYDTTWKASASGPVVPSGYLAVTVAVWAQPAPWNSTLFGIAEHYGYGAHWQLIWDDEHNAALVAKRGTPNLIHPGDVVYVPTT